LQTLVADLKNNVRRAPEAFYLASADIEEASESLPALRRDRR
jgi:hypothetical protein